MIILFVGLGPFLFLPLLIITSKPIDLMASSVGTNIVESHYCFIPVSRLYLKFTDLE